MYSLIFSLSFLSSCFHFPISEKLNYVILPGTMPCSFSWPDSSCTAVMNTLSLSLLTTNASLCLRRKLVADESGLGYRVYADGVLVSHTWWCTPGSIQLSTRVFLPGMPDKTSSLRKITRTLAESDLGYRLRKAFYRHPLCFTKQHWNWRLRLASWSWN